MELANRSLFGRHEGHDLGANPVGKPSLTDNTGRWVDMERATSIPKAIQESLRRQADKVVCRDADIAMTSEQVLRACQAAARQCSAQVMGPMVALLLPQCALSVPAGTMWAGKIPVPLNPLLKPSDIDSIFKEADIDTVIVSDLTKRAITGLAVRTIDINDLVTSQSAFQTDPSPVGPDDQAVLLYTSGTTGKPKGVPLTHNNILSNAFSFLARYQFEADDATLCVLPAFHAIGLTCLMIAPLLIGAEVTFARFAPERIGALVAERKVTVLVAVPSMYGLFVRSKVSPQALQSIHYAVSGGDALPSGVREGFRKRFGLELLEAYGLTETSPVISVNTLQENKPGTVGRVLPGVKVRISADGEVPCEPGREGEVQVQGPNVMSGYFKRPEENQLVANCGRARRPASSSTPPRSGFPADRLDRLGNLLLEHRGNTA